MDIKLFPVIPGGRVPTVSEALLFGGRAAGICYMPDSFESILDEPEKKTLRRIQDTIRNGHHSVYDHVEYHLLIVGLPKILAMVLNNEKMYTTSEKSARYTQMTPGLRDGSLYDKWLPKLEFLITDLTDITDEKRIKKLAQENARYMTSVFTPTTMMYTASLRQLNYVMDWFDQFTGESYNDGLKEALKPHLSEFVEKLSELRVEGLDSRAKRRRLSLFDDSVRVHDDEFGENYCVNYSGSFAQLAQAQRHRTLNYMMAPPLPYFEPQFYVPPIVATDSGLSAEWLRDIRSIADLYPQGAMVSICERGTYEDFVLKLDERLCTAAQLEIAQQTYNTLCRYLDDRPIDASQEMTLRRYLKGARCMAGYKCNNPCGWAYGQLSRIV